MRNPRLKAFIDQHGGYWEGECPEWPVSVWRIEVLNGDTRMGYWEWAYNSSTDDANA